MQPNSAHLQRGAQKRTPKGKQRKPNKAGDSRGKGKPVPPQTATGQDANHGVDPVDLQGLGLPPLDANVLLSVNDAAPGAPSDDVADDASSGAGSQATSSGVTSGSRQNYTCSHDWMIGKRCGFKKKIL